MGNICTNGSKNTSRSREFPAQSAALVQLHQVLSGVLAVRVHLWAVSTKILSQKSHDPGIVCKVDGFAFTPETAFTHHLSLASNSRVSISSDRKSNNLMEPSSCISEEFEHNLFPTRDIWAFHQSIKHLVDTHTYIGQLFAQIWFPSLALG